MKSISSALLAHKSSSSTTLSYLLLIGPTKKTGAYIGLTSRSRNTTYNPSSYDPALPNVNQTFYASTGAHISNLQASNDLQVDNGEAKSLVQQFPGQGITEAMVDNGELDGVEYYILQVNHKDLSMGHEVMANGPIGEVSIQPGGLVTFECRSWSDLLRQNSVCERDSLTCRVRIFGSQVGEEMFPCNYDKSGLWVTAQTVTSIGDESVRDFTASAMGQAQDYFAPGLILWLTGLNAGRDIEIETFNVGGEFGLLHPLRYPIQVGDTFDVIPDCTRQWSGHNSCETYGNRQWFRGEPFIPVSDTTALTVPGVVAGGG